MIAITIALIANQKLFGKGKPNKGAQPPKKKAEKITDKLNILPYSAKKKSANVIEEYSTLYPATISASAYGKSKGVRFVSAKQAIPKIIANGKQGTTYHINSCCAIIVTKFAVPLSTIKVNKTNEKNTS